MRTKTRLFQKAATLYSPPPAPFQPGDKVRFERQRYIVVASTHAHTQLQGLRYAVPNWQLKRTS